MVQPDPSAGMAVIFAWYVISYAYYGFAFIGDVKAIERHIASLLGRVSIAEPATGAQPAGVDAAPPLRMPMAVPMPMPMAVPVAMPVTAPVAPIAAPVLPSSGAAAAAAAATATAAAAAVLPEEKSAIEEDTHHSAAGRSRRAPDMPRPGVLRKLSNDMLQLYTRLRPPGTDHAMRLDLLARLQKLVAAAWPDAHAELHLFGSSANDFCLRNADMDICFTIDDAAGPREDVVEALGKLLKHSTRPSQPLHLCAPYLLIVLSLPCR